jgi:hypothetical protein
MKLMTLCHYDVKTNHEGLAKTYNPHSIANISPDPGGTRIYFLDGSFIVVRHDYDWMKEYWRVSL